MLGKFQIFYRIFYRNFENFSNAYAINLLKIALNFSIFYIFYEQYLTIWQDSIKSISMSLFTVFLIVYLLTFGNFSASLIILFTTTVIIVDMMALMYVLDIQLNALSLVNIIMVSSN